MIIMESITKSQNDSIRRYFDENSQKWYFSVVDAVGIIAKSSDARNYWKVLKSRLKKRQNELVTQCNQHKMRSSDGKFYLTDTADRDTMLKIIEIVSKENIPPFEQYFDNLESDRRDGFRESPDTPSLESFNNNSYPHLPAMPIAKLLQAGEELILLIDGYFWNNYIILECFVAGAIIENILISATSKTLTVSGVREKENNIYQENYLRQEIAWGKFSRKIELPCEIDTEKIEVTEYSGLLTIKLPIKNYLNSVRRKVKSI